MGKPTGKKNANANASVNADGYGNAKLGTPSSLDRTSSKAFDKDTTMFINMSQDLKEEGNRLYQKKDYKGAMSKYEKALKLLPRNHIDVAHIHCSIALCYMQFGLAEYPRAISECSLALEVSPRYSKALLRRAKCYEALNRLDLATRDVKFVLSIEPNNVTALEILNSVKIKMKEKGITIDEKEISLPTQGPTERLREVVKEKIKKKGKKNEKAEDKGVVEENPNDVQDKLVVTKMIEEEKNVAEPVKEEKSVVEPVKEASSVVEPVKEENVVTRSIKLVLGEDIRWAQLPVNSSMSSLRHIIKKRFPGLKGMLIKYRDQEGDLVTITSNSDVRLAESSADIQGSLRLYIIEVESDMEPAYEEAPKEEEKGTDDKRASDISEDRDAEKGKEVATGLTTVEDWILQFARLFKNHVGFDSDSYLDLHEEGMKLYSEAMEDTITSDDAQQLFDVAAVKFQEMAALALFNWGNVHMSKARKRCFFPEDVDWESDLEPIKVAYEWTQKEYKMAERKYEDALAIKPDFHDGFLALGNQQFEQAKLNWYYALANKKDIEIEDGLAEEVLELYNKAEDSMEKGMLMWEEMEEKRINGVSTLHKNKSQLENMEPNGISKDNSADEISARASNMRSQIFLLWGTLLYERSIVEYKLGMPTWPECFEVAVEKFELAGASPTDIAVMMKNHCSNETALDGFKVDEIVQAWHEMNNVQRWQFRVPAFRLEPLFRRSVPRLHQILERFSVLS